MVFLSGLLPGIYDCKRYEDGYVLGVISLQYNWGFKKDGIEI